MTECVCVCMCVCVRVCVCVCVCMISSACERVHEDECGSLPFCLFICVT